MDGEHGGATAGKGDIGDATSANADKAGAGGRHRAITAARERVSGWQENTAGESYGGGGIGEGREAYGVVSKPSRVGGDRGGCEAYGVAENPRGDRLGVGGEVESRQGIDTPRLDAWSQGDETPGLDTEGNIVKGKGGRERGGDRTPPHHPSKRRQQSRQRQQWHGVRAKDGGAAAPEGHGGR